MFTISESQETRNEWMTATEAAAYLRLPTVKALYQRRARGQVKGYKFGRSWRFLRRDLDALLAAGGR